MVNYPDLIFEKLDKNNLGYVKTNDLIKNLITQGKNNEDEELNSFYQNLNDILLTKSEEILFKLKQLQERPWIQQSKKNFKEKLKTIIYQISTQQLNDIDIESDESDEEIIKPGDISSRSRHRHPSSIMFLMTYSQVESSNQKARDFKAFRRQSRRYEGERGSFNSNSSYINMSKMTVNTKFASLHKMISPSLIARLSLQMEKLCSCDFDIFEVNSMMDKKTSIYLANNILNDFQMVETGLVNSDTLNSFITEIVMHYDREKAIYHNDLHAGDVMQTVYTIMIRGNMKKKMKLSDLDIFSLLIAALCHDYKHPGTNNDFSKNARTKYALRYNDISVLENFHIAQTFKVLSNNQFNILKNFSPEEYRIIRKRMVDTVLSTDMANHTKVLTSAKSKVELYDIVKGSNFEKIYEDIEETNKKLNDLFDAQQSMFNMIMHTADISNPGKPDKISSEWTRRVYEEFFVQGDMEKKLGLKISNFCDRNTTNINKAMIGFISFVVGPTIHCLTNLVPEVRDYSEYCNFNLRKHQKGAKNDELKALIEKNIKEEENRKKLKIQKNFTKKIGYNCGRIMSRIS